MVSVKVSAQVVKVIKELPLEKIYPEKGFSYSGIGVLLPL